jgi:hypothetical protein
MKIVKIYEEIKKKAGVEKVNPENIEKIREIFPSISPKEIAKKYGMTNRRSLAQLDLLLVRFFKDPSQKQKAVLFALSRSKPPTSLRKIYRELGLGNVYSCPYFISLKILEDLGLIKTKTIFRGNQRLTITDINSQKFKEYWPEIESWQKIEIKKEKIVKRVKMGEQMKRAFQIIYEEMGGKFSPEIVKIVKGLSRGDFHQRGWEITPRSLGRLKNRILKMPIKKFIKNLEEAQEAFFIFENFVKIKT